MQPGPTPTATLVAGVPPTTSKPPAATATRRPAPSVTRPAPQPTTLLPSPTTAPPAPPSPTSSRGRPVFPTPTVPLANGRQVGLEDIAFVGGYRYQPPSVYEGRTAVWIYGPGTGFDAMQAVFDVGGQPGGQARLTIAGMDSEGTAKTPLRILINNQVIFDDPNPLPNDHAPNAGNWGTAAWTFDATLLKSGRNTLTLENRADSGQIGAPPFIMLDSAQLTWDTEQ